MSVKTRTFSGGAVGDSVHSDDGSLDRPVGNLTAAGLVTAGTDPDDPGFDYRAYGVGVGGGAASAGEAAAHVIATDTVYDVEE